MAHPLQGLVPMVSVSQDSSSAGFSGDTVLVGPGGRRDSQASARSIWRSQESGARSQESGARSQESLEETRRLGVPGVWQSQDSGARSQDSGDWGRQRDVTSGWARARARARARTGSDSWSIQQPCFFLGSPLEVRH